MNEPQPTDRTDDRSPHEAIDAIDACGRTDAGSGATSASSAWPRRIASRLAARLCTGKGRFRVLDRLIRVPASVRPDLHDFSTSELGACWLGHATVLLRLGEITLLTDPVLGPKIGRSAGLMTIGPTRLTRPALAIEELPPIDVVLITRDRFDHLDRPTLRQIARRFPRCQAIVPSGCRDRLSDLDLRAVTEIDLQEPSEVVARGVHIRGLTGGSNAAQTRRQIPGGECGFLLERGRHRVLVAGDLRAFDEVVTSKPLDLAVVNIQADHADDAGAETPEEAWQFCDQIGARRVMPVHHSTFHFFEVPSGRSDRDAQAESAQAATSADWIEPIDRFLAAAGRSQHRVVGRRVGDTWTDLSDCRRIESMVLSSPNPSPVEDGPSSVRSVNDVAR